MNAPKVLTTGEIAGHCGVSLRTVIRWIERGHLKAFQLPGRGDNRVQIHDLLGFLNEHKMPIPEAFRGYTRRVLIVEDDPPMAQAMQASNGCAAVAGNVMLTVPELGKTGDIQGARFRWETIRAMLAEKLEQEQGMFKKVSPETHRDVEAALRRMDRLADDLFGSLSSGAPNEKELAETRQGLYREALALQGVFRRAGEQVLKGLAAQVQTEIRHTVLLSWISILGTLAMLLGSSVLGYRTARGVSRPVRLLAEATQRLSSGDFSARVEAAGGDEVALLARSFNEMGESLQKTQRELRDTQARVVQSEKMASLGQLAAGVAHEINNPTGFILSNLGTMREYVSTFTQLLDEHETVERAAREGKPPPPEALERIEEIRRREDLAYIRKDADQLLAESASGATRIKEIVQGLKSFARLDEAQEKEASINDCIETTLKVIWNELKYKCQVEKELGDVPPIRCYPGQINQVLMNLLMNAAQAIPERGQIRIETEATGTHVRVRISDTGKGIPQEHLSKIFDPFFTTKPVGQGTGLGLSIVHGIIQKHGGTIEVQSEVGKGTTFTISLPLRGGPDGAPPSPK